MKTLSYLFYFSSTVKPRSISETEEGDGGVGGWRRKENMPAGFLG